MTQSEKEKKIRIPGEIFLSLLQSLFSSKIHLQKTCEKNHGLHKTKKKLLVDLKIILPRQFFQTSNKIIKTGKEQFQYISWVDFHTSFLHKLEQ